MKTKTKKKINKKKVIILVLVVAIVLLLVLWLVNKNKVVEVNNEKDNMSTYGYTLPTNATDYYKSLYKELKTNINATQVNEEEYARSITKLFLTDFFTLSNKTTKSDIGGVQYVYASYQDSFMKYAKESIYKNVQSNLDGSRKQELPTVSNVEITKLSNSKYIYNNITDEKAYTISTDITYSDSLGYQDSAVVTIIHTDNKLEIIAME